MRTAIIDSNPHRPAVIEVGDSDLGAQRQGPVCRSQPAAVVALAACGFFSVEMITVYGCQAFLRMRRRRCAGNASDHTAGEKSSEPDGYAAHHHPMTDPHDRRSHY